MCEGKTRPLKYLGKNKNGSSRQIWHEPTPQDTSLNVRLDFQKVEAAVDDLQIVIG